MRDLPVGIGARCTNASPVATGGRDPRQEGETKVTIDELLEIEEIEKLRILYAHHLDGGEVDALAALFGIYDDVCHKVEGSRKSSIRAVSASRMSSQLPPAASA
jgi:hypothetical protein